MLISHCLLKILFTNSVEDMIMQIKIYKKCINKKMKIKFQTNQELLAVYKIQDG